MERAVAPGLNAEPPPLLTILYTVGLRGALGALPRLFTLIQAQRSHAPGITLTLDLGETCLPGDPLCDATAGRALLVAMDAMGYDAFYLDRADPLYGDAETLGKLRNTVVTPILTDSQSILLTKRTPAGHSVTVRVVGEHGGESSIESGALFTIHLRRGTGEIKATGQSERPDVFVSDRLEVEGEIMVGRIELRERSEADAGYTVRHERIALPAGLRPDPSISGVIEFVASEARYAARKRP